MASFEEGDPELKTDEALSTLTDFVTDVMIQLTDATDDEQILTFSNDTGGSLIDVLKEARNQLGKVDIRYLGQPSLDKSLVDFIEKANHLDSEFNEHKLKNSLKMMHHVRDILSFYLSQSWNSDLPKPEELSSQESAGDLGGGGGGGNSSNSSDLENSDKTPKRVLKKVTPKKKDYSYTCSHCGRIFTNAESYNKHQNENKLTDKVEIPKVSCMLLKRGTEKKCNSKQPLSLMYRHLNQSHGIPRPDSNQHLRYFESVDGGKTFTNAVFMPLNAPDPDEASYIDFDQMKDGKSSPKKNKKRKAKDVIKKNVVQVRQLSSKKSGASKTRKKLNFEEASDAKNDDNLNDNAKEVDKSSEDSDSRSGHLNFDDSDASVNKVNISVGQLSSKKFGASESRKKINLDEAGDDKDDDSLDDIDNEVNKSSGDSDSRSGHYNSNDSDDSINKVDSSIREIKSRKRPFDLDSSDTVPPVKIANQEQFDDSFPQEDVEAEKEKYQQDVEAEGEIYEQDVGAEVGKYQDSLDVGSEKTDFEDSEDDFSKSVFDNTKDDEEEEEEEDEDVDHSGTPQQLTVKVSTTSPESINEIPGLIDSETEDSDTEDSDTKEYSKVRIGNKKKRYAARDVEEVKETKLEDLPGNSEVITRFENFLKEVKYASNANKDTSTIEMILKHLFSHPHSFLSYMTEKDPSFRLNRLLMFNDVDLFLEIKSPYEWQMTEAGESGILNPSKRSTMLKSHAAFRDFTSEELESAEMGTDVSSLYRKEKLRLNLQNIDKSLKRRRIWSELDRLEKEEKRERDNLKEGLNPNSTYNETVAVQKWFSSQKFKELLNKHLAVWKKAFETKSKPNKADFVAFGTFAKFISVLQDKNRGSSYNFSNTQYICGQKLWFPQDGDTKDGWNSHQPRDRAHDAWQIRISGTKSGQKFGRTVTVTLEGYSKDLAEKFRDLKVLVFGDQLANDAPFYCNFEGNMLSVFKTTTGSLWSIFKETCDVDEATVTMIRRGLELKAHESQASLKRLNVINNHSEEVGLSHYDKAAPDYRSNFLHDISQQEGSNKVTDEELPADVIMSRKRQEEIDQATIAQVTQEKLSKATKTRYSLGRNMKLFPDDKRFIQDLLSNDQYRHLHPITYEDAFPAPKKFKSIFYRLVDSEDLKQEDRDRLRKIEAKTFRVVKEEVARKFENGWDGGIEVNKEADKIVAGKVRNSLKIYEKTKQKYQPTFFLF